MKRFFTIIMLSAAMCGVSTEESEGQVFDSSRNKCRYKP